MAQLTQAVERAELAVTQEEWALEVLLRQKGSGESIMQFMSDRLTNSEFYGWYVGQLGSLYQACYDATLSFCRLAERAFAQETLITATFVCANWDGTHQGLLAPDSLALDLERMDLAYTQYIMDSATDSQSVSFSLSTQSTVDGQSTVLEALLAHGEAVFELTDEMFDAYCPNQHDRRIQYVRVLFPDLQGSGKQPYARLTQLANWRYSSRQRDPGKAIKNVLVGQSLALSSAETDSRSQTRPGRRLGTFQGTGTHATWRLAIPSVVQAIQDRRRDAAPCHAQGARARDRPGSGLYGPGLAPMLVT